MKLKALKKILMYILSTALLLLFIFPFLVIIINSFKSRVTIIQNPLALPESLSFENYIQAFKAMNFPTALMNSIIVTTGSVLVIVLFSSMFAYFLVRWKWKINRYIYLTIVASMIIPFQSLMIPFVSIYGGAGLLDSKYMLMFFYLGFGLSLATFIYHGFIKGIPVALEEAAVIEGASRLQIFWKIIFPILKPITSTIVILDVLWIWNDFLLPSLVIMSAEDRTIPLSTFRFFGTYTSDYGLAMAGLVLAIIPIIIFFIILQKQIIRGVVEGAVK
ncbi:carbohydrate ABC transporter permease [Globicatella sulfidifaciens]|mgnify:CR=1 FL=1|uniref:Carbohydrate ABC transporter permease n=1 Tax=Globicatella sulfidifaciens TaxID=136093 RepID=A0A7X8C4M2_9LACT|nr:carbohydrate ABC transporter permease [Globicatella sulfidifaciens]NLJ18918.1 carbohydrate ABC transporter permease [Globicatella sulfidifaciens]